MKPNTTLDCRGLLCPAPILMTEERMADMEHGQSLTVHFTDPGAKPDLEAWCRATGNRALSFAGPDGAGKWTAVIRKT